jgi:hypothetical protein
MNIPESCILSRKNTFFVFFARIRPCPLAALLPMPVRRLRRQRKRLTGDGGSVVFQVSEEQLHLVKGVQSITSLPNNDVTRASIVQMAMAGIFCTDDSEEARV